MGTFRFGASQTSIKIDDRILAHLQTVITTKLRRSEGFLLQWDRAPEAGSGRGAAWIHPYCDLTYDYEGGRDVSLDHEELDRMMAEAAGTRGLHVRVTAPSYA